MLIKYTFSSKSQTLRMRYPFQSTGRPISHRNGWSFCVYMIPLRDFVPEWNSRPGARTGVNSRRGDSCRHNILWCYHVNKYRAMRGNRSELGPGRKSPRCHVNTPLVRGTEFAFNIGNFLSILPFHRLLATFQVYISSIFHHFWSHCFGWKQIQGSVKVKVNEYVHAWSEFLFLSFPLILNFFPQINQFYYFTSLHGLQDVRENHYRLRSL